MIGKRGGPKAQFQVSEESIPSGQLFVGVHPFKPPQCIPLHIEGHHLETLSIRGIVKLKKLLGLRNPFQGLGAIKGC